MRNLTIYSTLLLSLVILAHPSTRRISAVAKPQPCQAIVPEPSEDLTQSRFDAFADAFIVRKNITAAFQYISEGYINHDPYAQNGFDPAWNILSPIWPSLSITVLATAWNNALSYGWLHYQTSFGITVDKYRWDGGCIVEHWDQGEVFPS